jgi:integrase
MYRLGDTHWLRIPVAKLHNDRSVPLHPSLVGLINDYRAWRGPAATGLLVERDDHQPFDRAPSTVTSPPRPDAPASAVCIPTNSVTPSPPNCLNRGMSLEVIAALLGHRSPLMTLVYARIADTVAADQVLHRHPRRRSRNSDTHDDH